MSTANNCKILVTIPDQNEELLNALTIKFHFEYFTGMGSIEKVQLLPPNKAVVTFKDPQGKIHVHADKLANSNMLKSMACICFADPVELALFCT